MSIIHVNGVDLYFELEGKENAPVIVFSNSLGTNLSIWQAQRDALINNFRVLRYDTRGHGQSGNGIGPYTLAQLGNDVIALADALNIQSFSFCGISLGGLIGLWLGINIPSRLEKLIVCNTAVKIGSTEAWNERANNVRSEGMKIIVTGTPSRWFTESFIQQRPLYIQSLLDNLEKTNSEGYAACCDVLALADLHQDISTIVAPTLVIAGSYDPVTTVAEAEFITAKIHGAKQVNLPCSHLSNLENPKVFNTALLAQLEAH